MLLKVKLQYNLSLIDQKCYFGNTRCHYDGQLFDECDNEEVIGEPIESLLSEQVEHTEILTTDTVDSDDSDENDEDDESDKNDDNEENDDLQEGDDENMIVLLSGDEDGSSTSQSEDDDPDPQMGDD